MHVCHSLTRELEVLQDQLLAQFAASDPPTPAQIVVLLPDLPAAAPLIDAVFGTTPAPRRIPYTCLLYTSIRARCAPAGDGGRRQRERA